MEAMTADTLRPAEIDTFYFIGMTTEKSSIMKVFPRWAEHLGLGEVKIQGINCKWHDDPEVYRKVLSFIKEDPRSLGGLVTTHKLDILSAGRDLFDRLDENADILGEISCISKREGEYWGHAKDPITSGLSLEAIVDRDYWSRSGGYLCNIGAGGSSLALTMYVMKNIPVEQGPKKIVVTNRSLPRLEGMKKIHARLNPGYEVEYHHCPEPKDNDRIVDDLPEGSMVVNATGLGKDAPCSPLTNAVQFPKNGVVWEFNYRGDLLFLEQARAQQKEKNLNVADGWIYFIHGWTRVIAEVFNIDVPTSGPEFDALLHIASEARKETK